MLREIDVNDNLKCRWIPLQVLLDPPVMAPILLFYPQSKVLSTQNGYLKVKLQIDLLKV